MEGKKATLIHTDGITVSAHPVPLKRKPKYSLRCQKCLWGFALFEAGMELHLKFQGHGWGEVTAADPSSPSSIASNCKNILCPSFCWNPLILELCCFSSSPLPLSFYTNIQIPTFLKYALLKHKVDMSQQKLNLKHHYTTQAIFISLHLSPNSCNFPIIFLIFFHLGFIWPKKKNMETCYHDHDENKYNLHFSSF